MNRGGIVLCGGHSTRMGLPKATLPFGPELMLQRVVRLLGQAVSRIIVVSAADQDVPPLPPEVQTVQDRRADRGPLEGLAAGLAAMRDQADAVFVTGCDVPLMVPAFVDRMFELLGNHKVAVAFDGTFHHPLAAVYRTGVLDEVERLLAEDRLRPVFLFETVHTRLMLREDWIDVDPHSHTLANLNCPEDYVRAMQQSGFVIPPDVAERLQSAERG